MKNFLSIFLCVILFSCEQEKDNATISKDNVGFEMTKISIFEKDTVLDISAKLSKAQSSDLKIPFTIIDSSAVPQIDYIMPSEMYFSFKASSTIASFNLVVLNNKSNNFDKVIFIKIADTLSKFETKNALLRIYIKHN